MKTKTSFGRCLGLLIKKHDFRQTALSAKTGVAQATISRLISSDTAVDDAVATALCKAWPCRADNIQLLIAGLCDVIRRWGFDPEADVDIVARDAEASTTPTQADTDLEVLRGHMADDTVAELVHDLALILRRADSARFCYPASGADGAGTAAELKPFA